MSSDASKPPGVATTGGQLSRRTFFRGAGMAGAALAVPGLAACGGSDSAEGPIKLRFQSLAWQKQSIEVNRALVREWNKQHPDIHVQYVQGDWGSVHDQLLTAFEGGSPPDIIHYEALATQVFARGGYLYDLDETLSGEFKKDIPSDIWNTVRYDEFGTIGAPFLLESRLPLVNKKMLDAAGIPVPTPEKPWTWEEFQAAAKELTTDDTYGVAWPLGEPANAVVTLSQSFGGRFVAPTSDGPAITVGKEELEVASRIYNMLYRDKSAAPDTVSVNSTDTLPGFFAGKYAMVFGAIWLRQQMVEQAPDDFEWVTIPPLAGTHGQEQAVNPQILSVAAQSEYTDAATRFIEFFLAPKNMAKLARGDWLLPASGPALKELREMTSGKQGWDVAIASADALAAAPWRRTAGFQKWMDRIATPAFQRYFGNKSSLAELAAQLKKGGESTVGRRR